MIAKKAQTDLEYLRSLPKAGPLGYVYGIAVDVEAASRFDPALGTWSRPGISGVEVTLAGPDKSSRISTDKNGSFRFDHLVPGTYNISVAKQGYASPSGSAALTVHAGGCAFALQPLVVDRRILGRLTGADGLPARDIQVQLVPRRPTSKTALPFPVGETRTRADGSYELRNIAAGEYYLGINLAHTPSKQMPYTRYFYPGTEHATDAAVVIIDERPETATYNFSIPAPQRERRVNGYVYWPDGRPAEEVGLLLEDARWPWQTNTIAAHTDANGYFDIPVFEATTYRLHAVRMTGSSNDTFSAEPFALGPGVEVRQPLRLVLTRKGNPTAELNGRGLERWRAGLGF